MGKENKSLKLNMLLNAIKNLMAVVFPLISFPYVSRTLGVESLGQYNFATAVIAYIVLIAGLGIETYAIREGAKVREDKLKIGQLASQVFSINVLSSVFAYAILAVLLLLVPKFQEYTLPLLILSTQVAFLTIGVNWVFSIYEDFLFVTVRSIIFQLLAIIAMFVFIKDSNDVVIYCIITASVIAVSNLINFFVARKYCKIKFTFNLELKTHLKPILILFVSIASITIYTSSDTVVLGFICGEYSVGIYAVSHKIYAIVKSVLFSAIVVSIPRMAMLLGKNDSEEISNTASTILHTTLIVVIPTIIGLIALSEEIITLLSGTDYISAVPSFIILSVAIIFCLGGYFWGHAVLIPQKEENFYLIVTIISAIVNVGLNFILIPFYGVEAAAFTTLIAELVAFLMCYFKGRKYVNTKGTVKTFIKSIIASLVIIPVVLASKYLFSNMILYVIVSVVLSVILYLVLSIILKNQAVMSLFSALKNKINRKSKHPENS